MEQNMPSAPGTSAFQRKRMTEEIIDHELDQQRAAKRANQTSSSGPSSSKTSDVGQMVPQNQRVSDFHFSEAQAPPLDLAANVPVTGSNDTAFGDIDQQYSQMNDGDFLSLPTAADFYGSLDAGFGNIEWESMANNWGSFHDWGSWDMPGPWDQ